jgi:hypothetical protein
MIQVDQAEQQAALLHYTLRRVELGSRMVSLPE